MLSPQRQSAQGTGPCRGQDRPDQKVGEELGWLPSLRLGGSPGRKCPAAAVANMPSSGSIQQDLPCTEESPADQRSGSLAMVLSPATIYVGSSKELQGLPRMEGTEVQSAPAREMACPSGGGQDSAD